MHIEELKSILEKCKCNDRDAQFNLYKQYSKAMYNVCLRMVKNAKDAEDILQESFVKAFNNLDSYKYQATFGVWLKRIVINTSISFLNKNRILFREMEDHEITDRETQEEADLSLDFGIIKKAINELPEGYRIIFNMYTIEGYDHQEIGEILMISTSTSKSQYSRAKKKLREILTGRDKVFQISC